MSLQKDNCLNKKNKMKSLKLFLNFSKEEIVKIIWEATQKAFEINEKEQSKEKNLKSKKVKKIEQFLESEPFGYNTENVAKLISILLGEEVVFQEKIIKNSVPNPTDLALYKYYNYFYLQERIDEDGWLECWLYLDADNQRVIMVKDSCHLDDFTKSSYEEVVKFVDLIFLEINK